MIRFEAYDMHIMIMMHFISLHYHHHLNEKFIRLNNLATLCCLFIFLMNEWIMWFSLNSNHHLESLQWRIALNKYVENYMTIKVQVSCQHHSASFEYINYFFHHPVSDHDNLQLRLLHQRPGILRILRIS